MKLVEARLNKKNSSHNTIINMYTQENFSHAVGVTTTHYRNIEKGITIPSVKIAIRICKLLDVSVYDIDEWKE